MTKSSFFSAKISWKNILRILLIMAGFSIIGLLIWLYFAIGQPYLEAEKRDRQYIEFKEHIKIYYPDIYEQLPPFLWSPPPPPPLW